MLIDWLGGRAKLTWPGFVKDKEGMMRSGIEPMLYVLLLRLLEPNAIPISCSCSLVSRNSKVSCSWRVWRRGGGGGVSGRSCAMALDAQDGICLASFLFPCSSTSKLEML